MEIYLSGGCMENTNRIPVTYTNGKSEKELVDYNKLWQVAFWGFDTRIGSITNDSTTTYEIQSQFDVNSEEYKECDKRLKLFRYFQGNEIDRAKNGSKPKKLPNSWTTYQKILETDTEEEKARKEFENKLIIEKRPAFMKFLYSKYARQYKEFKDDFDLYCFTIFGKEFDKLGNDDKQTQEYKDMIEYYNRKNPFLETNGVMNRVCNYMQEQLKDVKPKNKNCDNQKIFEKLYNTAIVLDNDNLEKMKVVKQEYDNFKKTKQLKTSEFTTYEQYYKFLRNKCLQEISSNIQELANLGVYICYFLNPTKPKDFCWDVLGEGIVENLKEKHPTARVPKLDPNGEIEYLGEKYSFVDYNYNAPDTLDVYWMGDVFSDLEDMEDSDLFGVEGEL